MCVRGHFGVRGRFMERGGGDDLGGVRGAGGEREVVGGYVRVEGGQNVVELGEVEAGRATGSSVSKPSLLYYRGLVLWIHT